MDIDKSQFEIIQQESERAKDIKDVIDKIDGKEALVSITINRINALPACFSEVGEVMIESKLLCQALSKQLIVNAKRVTEAAEEVGYAIGCDYDEK